MPGLGTASPQHHQLIGRHLASGKLAFHYWYAPARPAGSRIAAPPSSTRVSATPCSSQETTKVTGPGGGSG